MSFPVPKIWTDAYLAALAEEAEVEISTQINCIYTRFGLNIVAGQSIYDLSDGVACTPAQRMTGIIRVTWLGHTVYPVFQTELREGIWPLVPVEGGTQVGRPTAYIRLGYGANSIKFFPAPNSAITSTAPTTTVAGIRANVIVAGWRIADPTSSTYRIPNYVRETLVRYYVMARAYKKEGKGQNLDASKYFEFKYARLMIRFKSITSQLFASRFRRVADNVGDGSYGRPARPQLPSNFGFLVD